MRRRCALSVLLLFGALCLPVCAQSLRTELFNSRRAILSTIWGAGHWIGFSIEEDDKDLNGDGDADDTLLCLIDQRTFTVLVTPIALDYAIVDDEDNWPVAFGGDSIAVVVNEADTGGRDLNGNGKAVDNVLCLYNPATRGITSLGVTGRQPTWLGGKLYFVQEERLGGADLNGDKDLTDAVLCVYDPVAKKTESLGMEAASGFKAAGDWIAVAASEAAQGAKDLNGDRDLLDQVVQLYQVSQAKWTNTGLEGSTGFALTPKLLAVSVSEAKQGARDLNGDRDTTDMVGHVWDLSAGTAVNTGLDCSGGVAADAGVAGFGVSEKAQGGTDLNGDRDALDIVLQAYVLAGARTVNVGRDASGGIVAGAGKLAFGCSETDQGRRDLNRDGDAEDTVVMVYDPVKNSVVNSGLALEGELAAAEGVLAWKMLESDQNNRDLNRDRDTDDSILCVMDLASGAFVVTNLAASENIRVTAKGVALGIYEADQGERDLNMNGNADDEVLHLLRITGR